MDEQFYPFFNQGINQLLPQRESNVLDPRRILTEMAKRKAFETIGRKVGIPALGSALGLGSGLLSGSALGLNPLGLGLASLAAASRGFQNYRQEKRDERARADAAARGLAKQRTAATQAMTSNQAYSGEGGISGAISNAQAAANREGRRGGQYG